MRQSGKKWTLRLLLCVAIVAVAVMLGLLLQSSALGERIEQRAYDLRFELRGPLPTPRNAALTLLVIDDESLNRIPDPLMLWQKHFAQVLRRLVEAHAAVVGVDFIFVDVEKYDPAGQQALLAALLEAGAGGVPVVLAYQASPTRVEQPPPQLTMALGEGGYAFANLTTDGDDFVRRQELFSSDANRRPSFPFAVALAFAKTGKHPAPSSLQSYPRTISINYRGRAPFPAVSFASALAAAQSGDSQFFVDHFQNRIVLIGSLGIEDLHSTPLYYWPSQDRFRRTPGIEIHGNTIATLLEGNSIRRLSERAQLLLTVLVVALTALFCFCLGPLAGLSCSLGVVVLYFFAANHVFASNQSLLVVSPSSGALLAAVSVQVSNFILEGREKRRLRQLFRRYVNDQVIEKILQAPGELGLKGETRRITVLFSDIRDFTTRSESVSAETLVYYLNQYFTEMVGAVQANGGMVDKFIGDGLMAVFGAPLDDSEAPFHAVEAARSMLRALRPLNARLASRQIKPIRIGIGIHTGEAVVGNVGSPQKMEYTAIGDVVNTASRIEGLNKIHSADRPLGGILISGETCRELRQRIPVEHVGEERLKGKAEAVPIYRVLFDETEPAMGESSRNPA